MKPDVEKIRAILDMPTPKNVAELQRFLGMVNYLGGFIENLAAKNRNLRGLLKKEVDWHWNEGLEKEFNNLKLEITRTPVLTFF